MKRVLAAVLSCLAAACEPADRTGRVNGWVFERDETTGAYHLAVAEVDHLESLRELRGRDIDMRRATALTVGAGAGGATVDVDSGSAFSLEYTTDSNGVVVPGDLHSFQALTLYRNLDRVAGLLRAHGHTPSRRLVVYYLPRYDNVLVGDSRLLLTDNAAYMSEARGFIIVPSFVLSALPMLLNEGVLAHEFGHAVIHQELFGDAIASPHENDTAATWVVAHRHLAAMHEGVADVFGFCATGDPDFILPTADVDRDMSKPRDFTPRMLADIETLPPPDQLLGGASFDPHAPGSVLARAVFELWPKGADGKVSVADRGRLVDATLASLRRIHDGGLFDPAKRFTLAAFLDGLAAQLSGGERARACQVLLARFAPLEGRLSSCGAP